MKVIEILYHHDDGFCDYYIAGLEDGRFTFAWGNMIVQEGEELTFPNTVGRDATTDEQEIADRTVCEIGASFHEDLPSAELAWLQCANARAETDLAQGQAMAELLEFSEEAGTRRLLKKLRSM